MTHSWRVLIRGTVQGRGVRPALARWATQQGYDCRVRNTTHGVELQLAGCPFSAEQLLAALTDLLSLSPAALEISQSHVNVLPGARIEASTADAALEVPVPLDQAVCRSCLDEFQSETFSRHLYGLISCVACGPRFSVMTGIPYDRERTSLQGFPLCARCQAEYRDLADRRGHAQTIGCAECGPQVWASSPAGQVVARQDQAVQAAAQLLRTGQCIALRGVGGYQLLVDATSEDAVRQLRLFKRRSTKPLAVMCRTSADAQRLAIWNAAGWDALQSPGNPIVLTASRADNGLALGIYPGVGDVGILLPTTAIHDRLLELVGTPLVCTSGNLEGFPLAVEVADAHAQLRGGVALFLHHDRPIVHPVDDSVVRSMADRVVTIRCARGLAPLSLPITVQQSLVAVGGHQKVAVALSNGAQSVLLPHIGDMETPPLRLRFEERVTALSSMFGVAKPVWIHDAHPEYFTTHWLRDRPVRTMAVPHHQAHIAAATLEHGWYDCEVLGIAWDGAGYGEDRTQWGGEFLRCRGHACERVASLRSYPALSGEQGIREPWRLAAGLLSHFPEVTPADIAGWLKQDIRVIEQLHQVARSSYGLKTSSVGRLFDVIAALVLRVTSVDDEGAAALWLESVCDRQETGAYHWRVEKDAFLICDWRPVLQDVLKDWQKDVGVGRIASRFHRGLARLIVTISQRFPRLPVVLGGGVFQNRVLVEMLIEEWPSHGPPLGLPGRIPPNDGGLAAGQLALAAHALAEQEN